MSRHMDTSPVNIDLHQNDRNDGERQPTQRQPSSRPASPLRMTTGSAGSAVALPSGAMEPNVETAAIDAWLDSRLDRLQRVDASVQKRQQQLHRLEENLAHVLESLSDRLRKAGETKRDLEMAESSLGRRVDELDASLFGRLDDLTTKYESLCGEADRTHKAVDLQIASLDDRALEVKQVVDNAIARQREQIIESVHAALHPVEMQWRQRIERLLAKTETTPEMVEQLLEQRRDMVEEQVAAAGKTIDARLQALREDAAARMDEVESAQQQRISQRQATIDQQVGDTLAAVDRQIVERQEAAAAEWSNVEQTFNARVVAREEAVRDQIDAVIDSRQAAFHVDLDEVIAARLQAWTVQSDAAAQAATAAGQQLEQQVQAHQAAMATFEQTASESLRAMKDRTLKEFAQTIDQGKQQAGEVLASVDQRLAALGQKLDARLATMDASSKTIIDAAQAELASARDRFIAEQSEQLERQSQAYAELANRAVNTHRQVSETVGESESRIAALTEAIDAQIAGAQSTSRQMVEQTQQELVTARNEFISVQAAFVERQDQVHAELAKRADEARRLVDAAGADAVAQTARLRADLQDRLQAYERSLEELAATQHEDMDARFASWKSATDAAASDATMSITVAMADAESKTAAWSSSLDEQLASHHATVADGLSDALSSLDSRADDTSSRIEGAVEQSTRQLADATTAAEAKLAESADASLVKLTGEIELRQASLRRTIEQLGGATGELELQTQAAIEEQRSAMAELAAGAESRIAALRTTADELLVRLDKVAETAAEHDGRRQAMIDSLTEKSFHRMEEIKASLGEMNQAIQKAEQRGKDIIDAQTRSLDVLNAISTRKLEVARKETGELASQLDSKVEVGRQAITAQGNRLDEYAGKVTDLVDQRITSLSDQADAIGQSAVHQLEEQRGRIETSLATALADADSRLAAERQKIESLTQTLVDGVSAAAAQQKATIDELAVGLTDRLAQQSAELEEASGGRMREHLDAIVSDRLAAAWEESRNKFDAGLESMSNDAERRAGLIIEHIKAVARRADLEAGERHQQSAADIKACQQSVEDAQGVLQKQIDEARDTLRNESTRRLSAARKAIEPLVRDVVARADAAQTDADAMLRQKIEAFQDEATRIVEQAAQRVSATTRSRSGADIDDDADDFDDADDITRPALMAELDTLDDHAISEPSQPTDDDDVLTALQLRDAGERQRRKAGNSAAASKSGARSKSTDAAESDDDLTAVVENVEGDEDVETNADVFAASPAGQDRDTLASSMREMVDGFERLIDEQIADANRQMVSQWDDVSEATLKSAHQAMREQGAAVVQAMRQEADPDSITMSELESLIGQQLIALERSLPTWAEDQPTAATSKRGRTVKAKRPTKTKPTPSKTGAKAGEQNASKDATNDGISDDQTIVNNAAKNSDEDDADDAANDDFTTGGGDDDFDPRDIFPG